MSGPSDSERKMKAYAWVSDKIQKGNKRPADRPKILADLLLERARVGPDAPEASILDLAIKTARAWP